MKLEWYYVAGIVVGSLAIGYAFRYMTEDVLFVKNATETDPLTGLQVKVVNPDVSNNGTDAVA